MNDAARVRVGDAGRDLVQHRQGFPDGEPLPPIDGAGEARAPQILHHQVRAAVAERPRIEDFDEAGKPKLCRRARFIEETSHQVAVVRILREQHLDRGVTAEHGVLGEINGAHAALADSPDQAMVRDELANEWIAPVVVPTGSALLGCHFAGAKLTRAAPVALAEICNVADRRAADRPPAPRRPRASRRIRPSPRTIGHDGGPASPRWYSLGVRLAMVIGAVMLLGLSAHAAPPATPIDPAPDLPTLQARLAKIFSDTHTPGMGVVLILWTAGIGLADVAAGKPARGGRCGRCLPRWSRRKARTPSACTQSGRSATCPSRISSSPRSGSHSSSPGNPKPRTTGKSMF